MKLKPGPLGFIIGLLVGAFFMNQLNNWLFPWLPEYAENISTTRDTCGLVYRIEAGECLLVWEWMPDLTAVEKDQ